MFLQDIFFNDLRDPSAVDYSEPIFDWLRNSPDDAMKKWESIITGELQQKQRSVLGSVTPSRLPHFKVSDMHKTRFCDFRFQLGARYLYCHQVRHFFPIPHCHSLIKCMHSSCELKTLNRIMAYPMICWDLKCICYNQSLAYFCSMKGDCKHTIVIRDMRSIHPDDVQNRAAYPIMIFQLKPRVQKCSVCKITRASKVTMDDKWARENPCYFCDYCYSLLHSKDESPLYSEFSVFDYLHD